MVDLCTGATCDKPRNKLKTENDNINNYMTFTPFFLKTPQITDFLQKWSKSGFGGHF
jgi:hypothetical protein